MEKREKVRIILVLRFLVEWVSDINSYYYQSTLHFTPLVTRPVHSCAILTHVEHTAISVPRTYRTHCHICPARYSLHLSEVK